MKKIENELYKKGFNKVAGLDEAGRGCLAGPLVVAICVFDKSYVNNEINDSKALSSTKRSKLFEIIKKDALLVDWEIFDSEFVDKNNPKKTSIIGMELLIERNKEKIDFCLLDAEKVNSSIPNRSIIKGDSISQTIAASSIVAKVIRDKIMDQYDEKFPEYDFRKNKGYGTKKHLDVLRIKGPIKGVHRFSYQPIKKLI